MARTKADARDALERTRADVEAQYEDDQLEYENDWGELDREHLDDDDDGEFVIRDALTDKRTVERTCFELHDMMHEGRIDLKPPYQRDVVWKPDRQSALIDSLFKGLHVPPVVFAVRDDPVDGKTYVCVDGQQRLTSVQNFIDSIIPHIDPLTKRKAYMPLNLSDDSAKNRIPQKYVQMFYSIKINCVEYSGIDEATEREIFERVQNGMPLQVAEKLQALNGPLVRWINSLQNKYVFESSGLTSCITWSVGRGKDFECLARTIYVIAQMPAHVFPGQQALNKWLKESPDPSPMFRQGICDMLDSFIFIASNDRFNAAFKTIKERVAPIEFVFICVLLAKMRDFSFEDKGKQALALRKMLRSNFKREVKASSTLCKSAFTYVDSIVDSKDVNWPTDDALRTRGGRGKAGLRGHKRTRQSNGDDDDEYQPHKRR